MTRRRIAMAAQAGGYWVTPEFHGDREELLRFDSRDSCDLDWPEIAAMFYGVQALPDLAAASQVAQACYHSSIGKIEILSPQYVLNLNDLTCDELFIIQNGMLAPAKRQHALYYQVYYQEQESGMVDTVQFLCPTNVCESELLAAVNQANAAIPIDEDENRLERMDAVLAQAAKQLGAKWQYLRIAGIIEVP